MLHDGKGDIGADHIEGAMGEIDHAHDAEQQRQPAGDEIKNQRVLNGIEQLDEKEKERHAALNSHRLRVAHSAARGLTGDDQSDAIVRMEIAGSSPAITVIIFAPLHCGASLSVTTPACSRCRDRPAPRGQSSRRRSCRSSPRADRCSAPDFATRRTTSARAANRSWRRASPCRARRLP